MRLLVAIALVLLATSARADNVADAAARFERAKAAYASNDYATAIAEFKAAFELDPRSDYLFGWAQALRRSGDCPGAVKLYNQLLELELGDDQRAATQQARSRCPPEVAPPPRPIVEEEPWYRDWAAHAIVLTGTVMIGAGTWATLRSIDDEQAARDAGTLGDHERLGQDARVYRIVGIAAIGTGAVLVGISALRYLSTTTPEPEPERVRVGGWVSGDGGGIAIGVALR